MKTEIVVSDRVRFDELVAIVERGMASFIEAGKALAELRDGKSYKSAGYATFEECCQHRFGIGRDSAYKAINASALASKMSTTVYIPNERVARELLTIKDESKQLEVVKRAAEIADAESTSITSAHVKQAKAEIIGVKPATKKEPAPVDQVIEAQAEVVPTISIAARYILAASESELAELFATVGQKAVDRVIDALEMEWGDEPEVDSKFVGPMRRAWITEETSAEEFVAITTSLWDVEKVREFHGLIKEWVAENCPSVMNQPSAPLPENHQPDPEMLTASYQHGLSGGDRDRLFHRSTDPGKRWNVIKELPPHKGVHAMSNLGKQLSKPYAEAFSRGESEYKAAAGGTPDQD